MADILSLDNPVFASYVFYATLSIAKMIDMGIWTSFKRIRHNIYATNEDVVIARGMAPPAKREKITAGKADERIERVRRNHLNDIENIPAFVLIGFFYLLTGPNASLALWHYRVFFISRVCHTIAYQWSLPQPARALSHVVGLSATFSMLIRILVATWKFY